MLGIIPKLIIFAIFFFLSLLPFPSPTCNPFSLCVWFGVGTCRHWPSPPARDAQTAEGGTGSWLTWSIPEKPIGAGGKLRYSSLPLQKAQMTAFPWTLNHRRWHTWCLTHSSPIARRVFPPPFPQRHGAGEAQPGLAGCCVFRANTSFNGKEKDLSFYMQRSSIKKKKKRAYYIPEYLPPSPKVKLRSNFSQEGDVCQTSTNHYLVFIFTY